MTEGHAKTIAPDEVLELLAAACPSFLARWEELRADDSYGPERLYPALGSFARHLVTLLESGATGEFAAVFDVVERLHTEGDSYVQEAATVGLLEGMQNIAGASSSRFLPFLRPQTAMWWHELNRFWAGEAPHVGAGTKQRPS
ncbi:hypothetical protein FGE12_19140 [Aggregicoccus sp. 17bor-14]|uniref:DUF7674 family protein n=1 Tax=Myxococcaceae TaxID=31 RepID=UPI00129D113B|nr:MULTISPECIES: hypothetical protein [Myxococcaceae]MBF5044522.1 hypothetical protein [Simulacricoccus sp. 17bor-14]MRI90267.1 hypothetical protein [Aggregicoccus sp. 17bor-14]